MSRIATIHGKNDNRSTVGWMRDGYLRYINKRKADAWSRSIGRQLPKDGTTKHRREIRILPHSDVFKGGAEMRDQLNAWGQQVFDALTGKTAPEKTLTAGPVTEIIRVMGGRGNSIVMAASKLQKTRGEHPEVTPQTLATLPSLLANPVFVLDNQTDTRSGDRLLVTDMVLGDDTVLGASIKRSGKDDAGQKATVLITAYGKDQFTQMMREADARGAILYVRGEREGSGYKHTGANSLNAPLRGTMSTLRAKAKILIPSRVFKSGRSSPETRLGRDREDANGKYHYDLSMNNGAEAMMSVAADRVAEARSGTADSLGGVNLDIAQSSVNRSADYQAAANDQVFALPAERKRLVALRKELRDELRQVGISSKITLDIRGKQIRFPVARQSG